MIWGVSLKGRIDGCHAFDMGFIGVDKFMSLQYSFESWLIVANIHLVYVQARGLASCIRSSYRLGASGNGDSRSYSDAKRRSIYLRKGDGDDEAVDCD